MCIYLTLASDRNVWIYLGKEQDKKCSLPSNWFTERLKSLFLCASVWTEQLVCNCSTFRLFKRRPCSAGYTHGKTNRFKNRKEQQIWLKDRSQYYWYFLQINIPIGKQKEKRGGGHKECLRLLGGHFIECKESPQKAFKDPKYLKIFWIHISFYAS